MRRILSVLASCVALVATQVALAVDDKAVAPFAATPMSVVDEMLRLAGVGRPTS